MSTLRTPLIVTDASVGIEPMPGLIVLERRRDRSGWGPLAIDRALERLAAIEGDAVVLSPHPGIDPGAAGLGDLAAAVDHDLVLLPGDSALGAFVVAVAQRWATEGMSPLTHRLWVLSSALSGPTGHDIAMRIGPRTLSAWARRCGRRCRWCRARCRACGMPCARCGDGGA